MYNSNAVRDGRLNIDYLLPDCNPCLGCTLSCRRCEFAPLYRKSNKEVKAEYGRNYKKNDDLC